MNEINACTTTRALFSSYLDGAVSGIEMQSVSGHLDKCADCSREFTEMRGMQSTLSGLGSAKMPADLALKLRVAISHESARSQAHWYDAIGVRWDNMLRPLLMQASAGFAGAVLLIGTLAMLLGVVATPTAVQANDEPLGALTSPHYRYSASAPRAIKTSEDTTIVVEAKVNSRGQVYDYNILSGPSDAATRAQVMDQLMLEVFEPAKVFGTPVKGHVIVTFEGISVSA
ncbi:Putative zinc-finger [Granulicella rosea]|uniref:Putative zinc-finger n=1 Tax=Granulicella rosea TaxID=474952 RepID=A0A239K729_9BACT|nr:zf-HC2 domain-containing protein [Granulicella rosea]SNT14266.1 Putative zinc-finger [Granulicella rosea]